MQMSSTKSAFRMLSCLTASVSSQMRSSPHQNGPIPIRPARKEQLALYLAARFPPVAYVGKKVPRDRDRQAAIRCVCVCDEIFIDSTA